MQTAQNIHSEDPGTNPCRPVVVVVDPDPAARAQTAAGLRGHGGFDVAAELIGAARADLLCRDYGADIIVAEIETAAGDGIAAIECVMRNLPGVAVVVHSSTQDDELLLSALRAGARGVLRKQDGVESLGRALSAVAAGEVVIPRRLTMKLIEQVRRLPPSPAGLRPVESALSTREWEILDRLRSGATTTDVADELFLTEDTVYSHLKSAMRKLKVHGRLEAIAAVDRIVAEAAGRPESVVATRA